ncbi:hypothetical protein QBC34DRAFT_419556 [Podospora aff. communis PSN243]|uniref:BHLH domain-containing protein n=1 Tax=Podospora aff. communis PSN243 TaxID=3040156 RepID=A0AAV9FW51_9PEZI|nr:hypothetical protein QBC34DRAFT_419556 [Podospora aff. communis PSN243]
MQGQSLTAKVTSTESWEGLWDKEPGLIEPDFADFLSYSGLFPKSDPDSSDTVDSINPALQNFQDDNWSGETLVPRAHDLADGAEKRSWTLAKKSELLHPGPSLRTAGHGTRRHAPYSPKPGEPAPGSRQRNADKAEKEYRNRIQERFEQLSKSLPPESLQAKGTAKHLRKDEILRLAGEHIEKLEKERIVLEKERIVLEKERDMLLSSNQELRDTIRNLSGSNSLLPGDSRQGGKLGDPDV